ncbi:DUF1642 domain-containing protein [Lactococcus garvieae]|uniref:DUF1642 domain-containing protein n=1 Tax=Lactococcus garvieae TaxID=1363 RepID=UPI001A8D298B|nr:DUF1642 domain-containing protein [Lactococcus garvieae]QSQ99554.1 DUF1642 domain-containing protein [Lactococcus garvieae]
MKKFELPEQPQKTNTSKDFTVAKEAIANLDKFDYVWKTHSHKLEKRFTAAIKYIEELETRLKECEDLRIEANNEAAKEYALKCEVAEERAEFKREIEKLKSQLEKQQPEIPEVPQFVGEWLDRKPLYAINGFIPVEIIEWSKKQTGYADIGMNINHLLKLKVNGYTVAKEKRFYLKHIDFCKRDKDYDWYMIKHSDGPLNHLRVEKGTLPPTVDTYFTQQEIDSMETGSYELVPVEDGE